MSNRARMVAMVASMILGASPARACPFCMSETGERVRAGIFGADFGSNVLAMLLPFPVFLAIVALIHLGPPWAKDRPGPIAADDADDTTHD